MQKEILEKYPATKLRVYVVWFSMLPTDARARWGWTAGVISDQRVLHFWDEKKLLGRWFAQQENPENADGGIVWDAFYLYGPEATWDSKPEPLISSGATVQDEAEELKRSIVPLLK
ncbi:MAG: hypothetical protein ABI596_14655 [Pyrinomonadaceae bacterium]